MSINTRVRLHAASLQLSVETFPFGSVGRRMQANLESFSTFIGRWEVISPNSYVSLSYLGRTPAVHMHDRSARQV